MRILKVDVQAGTPCLKAAERYGKVGKGYRKTRRNVELLDLQKKPYHLFLAMDEASSHVGRPQTKFRYTVL